MARKMVLTETDGSVRVLSEVDADDEAQLQTLLKENPDLLPVEEFGLEGPLMIVGEETTLPSGAVDLVGCTRGGALVIVELKTGPQNSDFRRVLAQLLDYGSDLWQMSLESFESTVSGRYFASDHCREPKLRGVGSLDAAARITWDKISDEECQAFADKLTSNLAAGSFEYVLAAQRFTPSSLRTIEYLNSESKGRRFYAVELVRFQGEGVSAFESRTVLKPQVRTTGAKTGSIDESDFLDSIVDVDYRVALENIFDACRGLGLRIDWGSAGASIRVGTSFRSEPVTVAWVFPPGRSGWSGLIDFNMGFDPWTADRVPEVKPVLERYAEQVSGLPGAERAKPDSLVVYHLRPADVQSGREQIVEMLAGIVSEVVGL